MLKTRSGAEQVNSKNQGATIPVWAEVIGTIYELSANDSHICVQIGNKLLCFPLKSQEAEILLRKLNKELRGCKVGLLRTDDRIKPLIVRLIDKRKHTRKKGKFKGSKGSKGKRREVKGSVNRRSVQAKNTQ